MRDWLVIAFVGIAGLAATVAHAQKGEPQWSLWATAAVELSKPSVLVRMPTEKQIRAKALRLRVKGGSVTIKRMLVTYGSGMVQFHERELTLSNGAQSEPFVERDDPQVVETIEIFFAAPAGRGPATIEVWGLNDDTVTPPQPSPKVAQDPGGPIRGGPAEGYTDMAVYFGTNRRQDGERVKNGRKLALFSGEQGPSLTLGRSIVTIPIEREAGSIPRPEIDLIIAKIAFRNEDPRRDFTIAAVDVMGRDEFVGALRQQLDKSKTFKGQALVFVHGYNVGFDDAVFRTAQLAHDMGFDGPAITFSWPSRGGTLDYRHDVDTAKASRDALRDLVEVVAQQANATSINIIAHSMGNDPLLEMLSRQAEIASAGGAVKELKIKEIIFAAPDVSKTAFEQMAEKLKSLPRSGVTLYASANDKALQASKRVASGLVRAGDVPSSGPVIIPGVVETIDVSAASTSFFSTNHSTFAEREQLIADMRQLMEFNRHPPSRRLSKYRLQGKRPDQFWQFVPK